MQFPISHILLSIKKIAQILPLLFNVFFEVVLQRFVSAKTLAMLNHFLLIILFSGSSIYPILFFKTNKEARKKVIIFARGICRVIRQRKIGNENLTETTGTMSQSNV